MCLVDEQACSVAPAQLADLAERRDVSLHREHPVDDHQDAAAVRRRPLQHLLELVHAVVAERAQLRSREQAAVEDRCVVARVDHHRVRRAQQRAQRAHIRLMTRREHERVLRLHPVRQLALELEVQGDRPVEQARAREARAVAVKRVLRAFQHALVARQAEVVVRPQHDPLRALHLDHRHRRRGQHVEVRQHVCLARRREHRRALVLARLREHVR